MSFCYHLTVGKYSYFWLSGKDKVRYSDNGGRKNVIRRFELYIIFGYLCTHIFIYSLKN